MSSILHRPRFCIIVLIPAAFLFSFSACNQKADQEEDPEEIPAGQITVTYEQFKGSNMKLGNPYPVAFQEHVSANGYIAANAEGNVMISTQIPGMVEKVNHQVGEQVRQGEVLFTMKGTEIVALQQSYAETCNRLTAIRASYERQKTLVQEQVSSVKNFQETESEYKSLLATCEGLKARLKLINLAPEEVEEGVINQLIPVYSPINGYLAEQNLVRGQFIEPGDHIITIIDRNQFQLETHVFEKDIDKLKPGQTIRFYQPDNPDRAYQALLTHIGKSVDRKSRTILCIARLDDQDKSRFVNGMYVEVEITVASREVIAIPGESLIKEGDHYFVLRKVKEEQGMYILQKVPVRLGEVTHEYAEILNTGLDDILIEGAYNLTGGE